MACVFAEGAYRVEALLMLIDSCVMILLVYSGLRNDAKGRIAEETGLFRIREAKIPPPPRHADRNSG
jgi:hypothetical protein